MVRISSIVAQNCHHRLATWSRDREQARQRRPRAGSTGPPGKAWRWLAFFLSFYLGHQGPLPVQAQPITPALDGTGTQVTLQGNQFIIQGGVLAGGNLFHSFQQFGLNPNQIATFLAQPKIQNILGRVVGGDASVIHGLIQVTGGSANLYLINPAGILFGPNASLNVPASFTATTANGVQIGSGWFSSATSPAQLQGLVGAPQGFAFTTAQPGAIVNTGNLAVPSGERLTLVGGTVINTGTLSAPGGEITLIAVPGEKLVRLSQPGTVLTLDLPVESRALINQGSEPPFTPLLLPQLLTGGNLTSATNLTVENGVVKLTGSGMVIPATPGTVVTAGSLDVSTLGSLAKTTNLLGGTVQLLGDRVGVFGAKISASGLQGGGTVLVGGDYQGQGTVPTAQVTVVSPDTVIQADALQQGKGGRIIVWSDQSTQVGGTFTVRGGAQGGDGGLLETSGKQSLQVYPTTSVNALAPAGRAGDWLLDPQNITIQLLGSTPVTLAQLANASDTTSNYTVSPLVLTTALSNVILTASNNITFNSSLLLTLPGIGITANAGNTIALNANVNTIGGDIIFNNSGIFTASSGATLNVVGNGRIALNQNPGGIIQTAVNAIGLQGTGGATINLGPGTYTLTAPVTITQPLTLNGARAASSIVSGNNTVEGFNVSGGTSTDPVILNQLTIINGKVTSVGGGANSSGAGIYNSGTLIVSNSTLSNNDVGGQSNSKGGGAIANTGTLTVVNSTLSGNISGSGVGAARNGGAISNISGTVTLLSSTVTNNSARGSGGGLFNAPGATFILNNSLIAGNTVISSTTANDVGGTFTDQGYNLIGANNASGLTNGVNGNLLGTVASPIAPRLTSLGDYGGPTQTYLPLPGSPALNAGKPLISATSDQRGWVRSSGNADIGSVLSAGYTLTATAGSGQTTIVTQPFGTQLLATLTENASNKPLLGASVTFTAPTMGAAGIFTGASTLTTNALGQVTIPITATTIAGTFTTVATVPGLPTPANFVLTNLADVPMFLTAIAGSPQSTVVANPFATNLQAKVTDIYGNPISGATVTFNTPGAGASGSFGGAPTVTTNGLGIATAPVLTADAISGSFSATSTSGALPPATFTLSNLPTTAQLIKLAGDNQTTTVNTTFGQTLQVQISDGFGNPISGAAVTFTLPATGATALVPGSSTLVTDAAGIVSMPLTANTIAGTYGIAAQSASLPQGVFSLTNHADVPFKISATAGTPQSTTVNTAFASTLQSVVQDQYGNPVPGVNVTFAKPSTGASGTFTGGTTLTTNALGLVSLSGTANTIAGNFFVTSTTPGVSTPASFSLTNTPDGAFQITPIGGTPQATPVGNPFPHSLQAIVTDQYGNAVPGVTVTFTPPSLGASGILSGGLGLTTDALGQVTVPIAANGTSGTFTILGTIPGTIPGMAPPATFTLTNLALATSPNLAASAILSSQPKLGTSALDFRPPEQPFSTEKPFPTIGDMDRAFSADYEQFFGLPLTQKITISQIRNTLLQVQQQKGQRSAIIYAMFVPKVLTPASGENSDRVFSSFLLRARVPQDDDRLDLVVVTATGATIRRSTQVTRAEVIAQGKRFRGAVSNVNDRQGFVALSQGLYRWLLQPIEADLHQAGITSLVYCLDEGLRTIPITAMIDSKGFVIQHYALSVVPSMGLTNLTLADSQNPTILAMGADHFQSLDPLPAVPTELNLVNQALLGTPPFLNEQFTLQNLLVQKQKYQPQIIHLATHAVFNPGSPKDSFIQLWDSQLTLDQMRGLKWNQPPIELLVLSACTTAIDSRAAELGFSGLAVISGARASLGSLWSISDLGTMAMMSEFYTQLKTAPTRSEALRRSQLALLEGKVRIDHGWLITSQGKFPLPTNLEAEDSMTFTHPFYWAGFTLIGNPW